MTRTRMPNERKSITKTFRIKGVESFYVIVGLYDDGRPGELFIHGKMGGELAGFLDGLAISISVGLQHGIPIEVYARKLRGMKFDPSGLTGDREFRFVGSSLDYLARWLLARFAPEASDAEEQTEETQSSGTTYWPGIF